jgi:hypothetical protein
MGLMDFNGNGLMGFKNLRDMFDGGGAGMAGQTFEGGPLSGVLNTLGVKPIGYEDRMAQARPQARPAPRSARSAVSAPAQPQPIAQQPLVGNLTEGDLSAAINRGQPPMQSSEWEGAASEMQRRNAYGPMYTPGMPMPSFQELMDMDRKRLAARAPAGFDIAQIFPIARR